MYLRKNNGSGRIDEQKNKLTESFALFLIVSYVLYGRYMPKPGKSEGKG